MTDEEVQRQRQEVLIAAQVLNRKVRGALAEMRDALQSLDKLVFLCNSDSQNLQSARLAEPRTNGSPIRHGARSS